MEASEVMVRTGDLIYGGEGGCVVIPEENHQHIVEACTLVAHFEKQAHTVLGALTCATGRSGL